MLFIVYLCNRLFHYEKKLYTLTVLFLSCWANLVLSQNQDIESVTDTINTEKTKEKPTKKRSLYQKIYSYLDDSNKEKPDKRFDISFVGGPSYSVDTKVGIGLVASGLYRIDRSDKTIAPSNVSLYGNFTTSGHIAIGIEGNTIFPHNDYRITYDMFFSLMPSKYWGIGYDKGRQKDNYTKFDQYSLNLKVDGLKKIVDNLYTGVTFSVVNIRTDHFENINFLEGQKRNNTAVGGGIIISYDSRDFIPNPYKGVFVKLEQNFFPTLMGSTSYFRRFEFTTRFYKKAWEGAVIAYDFNATLNSGDVPWNMLAMLGGSRQMRGYFTGQYRDKKLVNTQIEIRQHIYKRNGVVLWAGAGNVFSDFDNFEWSNTLPTFGLGYRWEFKKRVNIRLDYGFGKDQSGFYFNINEAF